MRPRASGVAPEGYVRFARLGRSFKLDGGVRIVVEVDLDDDELSALLSAQPKLFVPGLGETRLRRTEVRSGALVVHIEGVRDRTAARSLVNAGVFVLASALPEDVLDRAPAEAPEEAFVGLPLTVDGERAGEVTDAYLDTPNPYVRVTLADGQVALVPLNAPYVDVTDDEIALTGAPPGLLD